MVNGFVGVNPMSPRRQGRERRGLRNGGQRTERGGIQSFAGVCVEWGGDECMGRGGGFDGPEKDDK